MGYKIKVRPEDFIVKENSSLKILKSGTYSVFLLKKIGWNTDDLIRLLSRETTINLSLFSYGGRKDRHAVTEQFITIKGDYRKLSSKTDFFELRFLGFSEEPMSPRHITSNSFEITVRNIQPVDERSITERINFVFYNGFLNYFDEQRFRSFDANQGFIAEKILKRHYNGALKIIMTSIRESDRHKDKTRKRLFFENWGDWETCLKYAETDFEKMVFRDLLKNRNNFLNILRLLEKSELSIYFSAYQSFLFNEVLKKIVKTRVENIIAIKNYPSELYIVKSTNENAYNYLKSLKIPLAACKMEMTDNLVKSCYDEVLSERGIRYSMFNLRKIRKAYFKSVLRRAIVIPYGLIYEFGSDELYNGKKTLKLKFELDAGSYATMLIKQIFI